MERAAALAEEADSDAGSVVSLTSAKRAPTIQDFHIIKRISAGGFVRVCAVLRRGRCSCLCEGECGSMAIYRRVGGWR